MIWIVISIIIILTNWPSSVEIIAKATVQAVPVIVIPNHNSDHNEDCCH